MRHGPKRCSRLMVKVLLFCLNLFYFHDFAMIFLFLCTAGAAYKRHPQQIKWQAILMENFLSDVSQHFVELQSCGIPIEDVSQWPKDVTRFAIECADGLVNSIRCTHINEGNFHIEHLPHDVTRISMPHCK